LTSRDIFSHVGEFISSGCETLVKSAPIEAVMAEVILGGHIGRVTSRGGE
jgi:hypothetical protein